MSRYDIDMKMDAGAHRPGFESGFQGEGMSEALFLK